MRGRKRKGRMKKRGNSLFVTTTRRVGSPSNFRLPFLSAFRSLPTVSSFFFSESLHPAQETRALPLLILQKRLALVSSFLSSSFFFSSSSSSFSSFSSSSTEKRKCLSATFQPYTDYQPHCLALMTCFRVYRISKRYRARNYTYVLTYVHVPRTNFQSRMVLFFLFKSKRDMQGRCWVGWWRVVVRGLGLTTSWDFEESERARRNEKKYKKKR